MADKPQTITFKGTVRVLLAEEFVETPGGRLLFQSGVVIESEDGNVVAYCTRDGYKETFGREPLEPAPVSKPLASVTRSHSAKK